VLTHVQWDHCTMRINAQRHTHALLPVCCVYCTAGGGGWEPGCDGAAAHAACLADVATVVTLAELYPDVLRQSVPPQMASILPRVLDALSGMYAMLAAMGDRAALLVTQDAAAAVAPAMLEYGAGDATGYYGTTETDWRVSAEKLLEAAAATKSSPGHGPLLHRVHELSVWASGAYAELMSRAVPLRRGLHR
jgi:hypothetical protein